MQEFARENINALTLMKNSIRNDQVRCAVSLICDARTVYLAGVRRSFPVAAYLSYALRQAGKPQVHLLDGRAGMMVDQGKLMRRGDLLIATSFAPYASETVTYAQAFAERGVPLVSITDSVFSPLTSHSTVWFEVAESDYSGFRSISASMALAMALPVAIAEKRRQGGKNDRVKVK